MYHCHTHFYFVGRHGRIYEIMEGMPPLEHFTHEFVQSDRPEKELMARADVILADLQGLDAEDILDTLTGGKREKAELILIADSDQIRLLGDRLCQVRDIWTAPMSDEEVRFRFLRWQQTWKMGKDYWQTSHFFESAINNIPNLIWFKDKDGVHEKVNDSFCRTVNKTKQQVEGQKHAYIWDVEQDDPACIESERLM